jgi:hypothetical protein
MHGLNTEVGGNDFHDVILGARIGRACYELYHQAASGLAPDSVTYKLDSGDSLGPRENDNIRPPGTQRHRRAGLGKRCGLTCGHGQGCVCVCVCVVGISERAAAECVVGDPMTGVLLSAFAAGVPPHKRPQPTSLWARHSSRRCQRCRTM